MSQFVDLDAAATLRAVESRVSLRRRAEVDDLALAVHWAGLHGGDPEAGPVKSSLRAGPRLVTVGGEGTPPVVDLAFAELGTARQTHPYSARSLVADGLDLVFWLPRCQEVLAALECEPWLARRVASMTRHLSAEEAGYVDAAVAPSLAGEQPSVVLGVCGAKIIEANPEAYRERLDAQERRKYVSLGKMSDAGLRHVIAQIDAGDAVYVDAVVARVAQILKTRDRDGGREPRSNDERRAAAFGMLARPAELLWLLLEHAHEADLPDLDDDPDTDARGGADAGAGSGDETGANDSAAADDGAAADQETDTTAETGHAGSDPTEPTEPTEPEPAEPEQTEPDPGPMPTPERDPDAALLTRSGRPRRRPAEEPPNHDGPDGSPGAGWVAGFPAAFLDVLRGMDPAELRPRATLYLHLHQAALATSRPTGPGPGAVVNVEQAGPCLPDHLAGLLGDTLVTVSEVVDLNGSTPVSAYVHPQWLKDQVQLISPRTAFPHSTTISRHVDYDHTVPYRRRGESEGAPAPPGQTGLHNSGPLGRYQHRVKTHAHWSVRQPGPGTYVWRTTHGLFRLVDAEGTHVLDETTGRAIFATAPDDDQAQRAILRARKQGLTLITPEDLGGTRLEIADDFTKIS